MLAIAPIVRWNLRFDGCNVLAAASPSGLMANLAFDGTAHVETFQEISTDSDTQEVYQNTHGGISLVGASCSLSHL